MEIPFILETSSDISVIGTLNLAEPDTILTTMHMVKAATENSIQTYTIFTNNQQLSKITIQMTWLWPTVWEILYPV